MASAPAPGYEPFRPRFARWVSLGVMWLVVVGTVVVVLLSRNLARGDQVGFVAFGALVAWFCWREASVSAKPDDEGLTVRNLVVTTRLQWAEVVAVRFGDGNAWVQLDIANGDTLAVMGIQRADKDFAQDEARRLATLVAEHSRTERDT
jgi:hypothetical protein